jgi:phosphoglycerate dehydrogenase-like enzyme
VVRPATASANAEAEFTIGALLQMLRRVPVINAEGLAVGREVGGSVIGIVGMTPAARPLASLLDTFGARVIGYDPAVHAGDGLWDRWGVEPVPLRQLMEHSDGVCVLLSYYSRYHGLLGQRYLSECKPNQVLVSLAPSGLFDEQALAHVLATRRMAAAWFDSMEPGTMDPGRPLHDIHSLQITPRVASTTRESRIRSAWAVAQRMDEILKARASAADFTSTTPGALAGLEDDPAPA